ARICSIGQPDGIDPLRIVDWANRGLGDRAPWTLTVLACAEARAGHFQQAIEHYQESNTLPGGEELRARNFFGLAMIHYRLGQIDAVGKALEKARELFQFARPTTPGGAAHLFAPGEWIEQNLLSREAEALIQGAAGSTAGAIDDR